jgi:hypothetical protein
MIVIAVPHKHIADAGDLGLAGVEYSAGRLSERRKASRIRYLKF